MFVQLRCGCIDGSGEGGEVVGVVRSGGSDDLSGNASDNLTVVLRVV